MAALKNADTALKIFISDHTDPEPALQAVAATWWLPGADQQVAIAACKAAINALPDTSAEDQAREYLIVAQDRYEKLLMATKGAKEVDARRNVAEKILKHYNDTCTKVLEGIFEKVATDFTNYYRVINRDDEDKFIGSLKAAPAKLNFDVDFYGRGLFPPGAYHSEGHQDGMGLCLYLALMKHTLGDKFTFAVLDDVLMSVDAGHRRDVCRLLKTEFPNTQFILTTHDRIWLQYMKTEQLIARSQSFGGWTVDAGPRVWDDDDIWVEIQNELDKNDVAKAAALLRRYLEYTATILADKLRARVEFSGDARYDLSDLLPHVSQGNGRRGLRTARNRPSHGSVPRRKSRLLTSGRRPRCWSPRRTPKNGRSIRLCISINGRTFRPTSSRTSLMLSRGCSNISAAQTPTAGHTSTSLPTRGLPLCCAAIAVRQASTSRSSLDP